MKKAPKSFLTTGQRFGRWTVLSEAAKQEGCDHRRYLCRCDCGKERSVIAYHLVYGQSKSCGCLNSELTAARLVIRNTTHGMRRTYLYRLWANIKTRCTNKSNHGYAKYGARGIAMYSEWINNPKLFMEYIKMTIGDRPNKSYSIDRKDNNKGYLPGNLRWATLSTQARNKRNTVIIVYNGEAKTAKEWSESIGINDQTLLHRVRRYGWSDEKAITTPVRKSSRIYKRTNQSSTT